MENPSYPVRLTYADLCRLPDDGLRHELIDGFHYVTPAPRLRHQRISGRIFSRLSNHLAEHPLGEVFYAPVDVVFSEIDAVEPDLLYVSREREDRVMTEDNLTGAPDLVVEILSPSTRRRDLGIKHHLYERFGVPEYWIIDPENETARVYRSEEGSLPLVAELSRQGSLSTPLLPGLEIPLDEVFR